MTSRRASARGETLRVLVAPNAFKGTLSPLEAARAIRDGLLAEEPSLAVELCPVSDGGDGLIEALVHALGGELRAARVTGPLGEPVQARWALLPDGAAVLETAEASGLKRLPPGRRDALRATTRGVGELLLAATEAGAKRALLGVGGSATTDGGAGMAQALGARLLDEAGAEVGPGGGELGRVARIEASRLDARVRTIPIEVACDVTNPLLGPSGAARLFAPQKGASAEEVERLERALAHWAEVLARDLGRDVRTLPGAGAAGGLAAGLAAFLDARLLPGAELVLDRIGFEARLARAEVVVTGEGSLDAQTALGKAPAVVAARAARALVPCVALAGSIAAGLDPATMRLAAAWGEAEPGAPLPADPAAELSRLARARAGEILRLARRRPS